MTLEPSAIDTLLDTAPQAGPTLCEYSSFDGARLGFVAYRAASPASNTALVYLHGIESHAGWFDPAARLLQERGYDCYCLDRRGSGINRENRGFRSGHVSAYEVLCDDIRAFLSLVKRRYSALFLAGLSWGGKLATAYALLHPADCAGLILITPGLKARVDVSLWAKLRVFFSLFVAPTATFKIPIEPEMFSADPQTQEFIRQDPLRLRKVTAQFLYQSRRLDGLIRRELRENRLPVQLFVAGRDQIIDSAAVVRMLQQAREQEMEIRDYAELTHAIQLDATRRLVGDMADWLKRHEP